MPENKDRAREFVMGFVATSERYKQQYIDRWTEVVENFIVEPYRGKTPNTPENPYRQNRSRSSRSGILLKDPETHKAIMIYASKLVKTVFGDPRREYVRAKPVGWEDAGEKSSTVTRLLRYAFALPGFYRTMVEAVIDMLLFGTSVVEIGWRYETREMPARTVRTDFGIENDEFARVRVPSYDDVEVRVLDVQDFFPDPSQSRIEDMCGVAKKFHMTALKARAMVQGDIYDSAATERAIGSASSVKRRSDGNDRFREDRDQPIDQEAQSDFKEMIGYEYWGDVPWEDDRGSSRRVVTILNNEVVRDEPYPFSDVDLPFRALVINPVHGRFYGISPAEVIRWDQDFADALKQLLAEAVVRDVHPPIAYDTSGEIDAAKIMRWQADLPIGIRGGPSAVGTLRYDSNIPAAFSLLGGLKQSMQETSGALGSLGGQEGPDREPATVGALRYQNAMDRPELGASLLENDALPLLSKSILRRYQQFTEDTEDLKRRIGELPEPAWIGDIMGDFDVEFVGSRQAMSRQMKLQAFDRLISYASAIPQFAAMVPLDQLGAYLIGDVMELPEVAALIADPQIMQRNVALQMMLGQGQGAGNGNGTTMAQQPAGALPAQMGGANVETV